jgi:hypothetical protein
MRTRSLGVLKFKDSSDSMAVKKKTFENFCKNLKLKKKEKKLNLSYP